MDPNERSSRTPRARASTQPLAALLLAAVASAQGPSSGTGHWAFTPPPATVEVPPVRATDWPRSDVDRFVLARLEAEGLDPAADADRRTWIRRVTFDLIGLPPTPDEVDAFVADRTDGAEARVVDRLLASDAYGERIARRWLDLVRYSDSNGLDENLALSHAWRYRDWVVRALNDDVPYDRFVTMQIAGDLMPRPDDEQQEIDQRTATAFWSLGPKMLAEQDKEKLVMDVVDEQIDVLSRTALGLTVACARCHDHKFDPISTRDYYALAGILKSTSTMEELSFVSRWREVELASTHQRELRYAWQSESTDLDARLEATRRQGDLAFEAGLGQNLGRYLLAGTATLQSSIRLAAADIARGNLNVDRAQWGSEEVPIVHTKEGGLQHGEWDFETSAGGPQRLRVRYAAEESRPVRLLIDGVPVSEAALAATTGGWMPKDQRWFDVGSVTLEPGRHVLRLERHGSIPHVHRFSLTPPGLPDIPEDLSDDLIHAIADHLAEPARGADPVFGPWLRFAALGSGDAFREGATTLVAQLLAEAEAAAGESNAPRKGRRNARPSGVSPLVLGLVDGQPPASLAELAARYQATYRVVQRSFQRSLDLHAAQTAGIADPDQRPPRPEALADPEQEELRASISGPQGLFAQRGPTREGDYPSPYREQMAALAEERARLDARRPAPIPSGLGVVDGAIVDVPIHRRGDHLNLADSSVPRGTIALFDDLVPPVEPADDASGRLELARWLFHPEHPLTARVLANRVWQLLFGEGLVRTPSNFGPRGESPTHPELLDWLARRVQQDGWSIKQLIRTLALSRTYAMASRASDDALTADPDGRLLTRFANRRLDAEAIRDGILAVAGTLDRTLGGTLLDTPNRDYVTNDQSNDRARYSTPRRSIYLPLIRNSVYDQFTLFDFNDPSVPIAHRPRTAVPIQALWLMNSDEVEAQSLAFARRVLAVADSDDRSRIDRAFVFAFARPATDEESGRMTAFLDEVEAAESATGESGSPARERAWAALCQVLLASNEFLHVD
ncbi:MAG: DUF1549 domain-containing protein [Planctomycetota bacterium]|nr:DUF1549 domain-containing protein [Planctomycetota bacterium]